MEIKSAGKRLQILREAMGITRDEFVKIFDLHVRRLENIEYGKIRMGEEEFENICRLMPEFSYWITFGGDINLKELKASKQRYPRFIAAKYESDLLPPDSPLLDAIK